MRKSIQTVGIIGGGQLGMMMCEAARQLGYRTVVLDPSATASARRVCDDFVQAPFDDLDGLRRLAQLSDVLTYEFENIPAQVVQQLMHEGVYVPQTEQPLYVTQHRLREKKAINDAQLPTAPFVGVQHYDHLCAAFEQLGSLPAILKTCFGGYDGKGQWSIATAADLPALAHLFEQSAVQPDFVLEQRINLATEVSCVVVRSTLPNDPIQAFPLGENVHRQGILHYTTAPAQLPAALAQQATQMACQLMQHLGWVGTLAVEMFVDTAGKLYINELAPRPHNSGHHTIEACNVSQFSQHIRAVVGLPLVVPQLLQNCLMLNVIGDEYHQLPQLAEQGYLHDYHKTVQVGRKMAHITFVGEAVAQAQWQRLQPS